MPTITQATVAALKPGELLADDKLTGFICRCLPSGRLTYGLRFSAKGKQRWLALGVGITAAKARELAEKRRGEVADRRDPQAERQAERRTSSNTVNHVLDEYLKRHAHKLRSAYEIERCFDKEVRPVLGAKVIYELRRADVRDMHDRVNGDVMADRVLDHLRAALNWWQVRDDEFTNPIVKGLRRAKSTSERARKRVLDDAEIRDLWKALDTGRMIGCYPRIVRLLLLSARRREECARMRWERIDGDVWTIPAAEHKTGAEAGDLVTPVTPSMRAQMGEERRRGFVFQGPADAAKPFVRWSAAKRKLDEAIAELRKAEERDPMPAWTLHDLRRTARSLMSRAGVNGDVAERVLGHVIPGVRGVYDRHQYFDEKRDALEKLGKLVERILAGEVTGNVVRPAQWSTA
jgi:integrase